MASFEMRNVCRLCNVRLSGTGNSILQFLFLQNRLPPADASGGGSIMEVYLKFVISLCQASDVKGGTHGYFVLGARMPSTPALLFSRCLPCTLVL